MMLNRFLWCIGLLLPVSVFGQLDADLLKSFLAHYAASDKVYVQTNHTVYPQDGTIYFQLFLTNHRQELKSGVVYADLIHTDTEIIDRQIIKVNQGIGTGQFQLKGKKRSDTYLIRAYTNWMCNQHEQYFFRKLVRVDSAALSDSTNSMKEVDASKEPILSLFPEGGTFVLGTTTRFGVMLGDFLSDDALYPGVVLNQKEEIIAEFTLDEQGLGSFEITPQPASEYRVLLDYKGGSITKKLPQPAAKGVSLKVEQSEGKKLKYELLLPGDRSQQQPLLLLAHQNDQLLELQLIDHQQQLEGEISLADIPPGLINVVVLDENYHPIAQRLTFNRVGYNDFNIDYEIQPEKLTPSAPMTLYLDLYDNEGRSLSADLVVTTATDTENHQNIQQYFWLSSELGKQVPVDFFAFDNLQQGYARLDEWLLCQTMTKFRWENLKEPIPATYSFLPESSLSLSGYLTKKDHPDKTVQGSGFLTALDHSFLVRPFTTDAAGRFTIDSLEIFGNKDVIIQVAKGKGALYQKKNGAWTLKGDRRVDITIEEPFVPPVSLEDKKYFNKDQSLQNKTNLFLQDTSHTKEQEGGVEMTEDQWSIDLETVTVTAEKIDKLIDFYEEGMVYRSPDYRIRTDKLPLLDQYQDIYDILRSQVSGLELARPEREGIRKTVILRGVTTGLSEQVKMENGARFMVDGAFVSQSLVEAIPPNRIAFVDVIKSLNKLTPYGELGVNGLIMIYLKPPVGIAPAVTSEVDGIFNYKMKGYAVLEREERPSVPLWGSFIKVRERGEARFLLDTSTKKGDFTLIIEGIGRNNLPIYFKTKKHAR